MRLALLTFGDRASYHSQACFAILTYLGSDRVHAVSVVTDRPDYYRYFGERVSLLPIEGGQLAEWRGSADFFWRAKIRAIDEVVRRHPGEDVLYVDTDTVLTGDLADLDARLAAGRACMYECEGRLGSLHTKTERQTCRALAGRRFGPIEVTGDSEMWNAGVIGLPAGRARELTRLSLSLCDEMCATPSPRRLLEQLAFSLALGHSTTLSAASAEIAHYWGNKPAWDAHIAEFFLYSRLANLGVEDDLRRVATSDLSALPIMVKQRNSKLRIFRLLDKLFRPRFVRYAGQPARPVKAVPEDVHAAATKPADPAASGATQAPP